mmetsp:Transcript_23761/g.55371  ORF Transcript_23761/g.55371 Transcript_23761/m.55371 type:complete len:93 (-) Transcript_23761:868-1146(-)
MQQRGFQQVSPGCLITSSVQDPDQSQRLSPQARPRVWQDYDDSPRKPTQSAMYDKVRPSSSLKKEPSCRLDSSVVFNSGHNVCNPTSPRSCK